MTPCFRGQMLRTGWRHGDLFVFLFPDYSTSCGCESMRLVVVKILVVVIWSLELLKMLQSCNLPSKRYLLPSYASAYLFSRSRPPSLPPPTNARQLNVTGLFLEVRVYSWWFTTTYALSKPCHQHCRSEVSIHIMVCRPSLSSTFGSSLLLLHSHVNFLPWVCNWF